MLIIPAGGESAAAETHLELLVEFAAVSVQHGQIQRTKVCIKTGHTHARTHTRTHTHTHTHTVQTQLLADWQLKWSVISSTELKPEPGPNADRNDITLNHPNERWNGGLSHALRIISSRRNQGKQLHTATWHHSYMTSQLHDITATWHHSYMTSWLL